MTGQQPSKRACCIMLHHACARVPSRGARGAPSKSHRRRAVPATGTHDAPYQRVPKQTRRSASPFQPAALRCSASDRAARATPGLAERPGSAPRRWQNALHHSAPSCHDAQTRPCDDATIQRAVTSRASERKPSQVTNPRAKQIVSHPAVTKLAGRSSRHDPCKPRRATCSAAGARSPCILLT